MKIVLNRSQAGSNGSITYEASIRLEITEEERPTVTRFLGKDWFVTGGMDMRSLAPKCDMITVEVLVNGIVLRSTDLQTILKEQRKVLDACRNMDFHVRTAASFTGPETIDLGATLEHVSS